MKPEVISRTSMQHLLRKQHRAGRFLALEEGPCGPVLVACRSLPGSFAVEEFCAVADAVRWLQGEEDGTHA